MRSGDQRLPHQPPTATPPAGWAWYCPSLLAALIRISFSCSLVFLKKTSAYRHFSVSSDPPPHRCLVVERDAIRPNSCLTDRLMKKALALHDWTAPGAQTRRKLHVSRTTLPSERTWLPYVTGENIAFGKKNKTKKNTCMCYGRFLADVLVISQQGV